MIHPRLDLASHGDVTSMSDDIARQIAGWSATCVESVVAIERVRKLAAAHLELGESVPVDIFIPNIGAPVLPFATKVGGVPFRPAEWAWPIHEEFGPMTFVCQFNFGDSRDIVPPLPGDILLVFSGDFPPYSDEQGSCLHLEWYTPRTVDVMTSASGVRGHPEQIPELYGVRHRTVDYSASPDAYLALLAELDPGPVVPKRKEWLARGCVNLMAWKIGGRMPDLDDAVPDGTFICSLVDLCVEPSGEEGGHVNGGSKSDVVLLWYDGFTLSFFIDSERRVQWHLSLN